MDEDLGRRPAAGAGLAAAPQAARPDARRPRLWAAWMSAAWLLFGAVFVLAFWDSGSTPAQYLALGLAILLPLVLIWIVSFSMTTIGDLRAESVRLRATVDQMRRDYVQRGQTAARTRPVAPAAADPDPGPPATFSSRRDPAALQPAGQPPAQPDPPLSGDDQPALAFPADDRSEPVALADVIRALDFPDSAEDRAGIEALRRALADRGLAKLIRAAQDVLSLLSQDGIFMDDLVPDRAHPDLWRRFAGGERGRTVAALGGIRDRSSLTLSAMRMRNDTIFRDAAHHFLRQFDRSFQALEPQADDAGIAALTDTRTARAFMLLGRVSGTFD